MENEEKEQEQNQEIVETIDVDLLQKRCAKLKKIVIVQSVVLIICALLFVFAQFLPSETKEHLLTKSTSPDGNGVVTLYEVGSPYFFGSSKIRIYYTTGEKTPRVLDTEISNDGAALYKENYNVSWEGETAVITLDGEEQSPVTYRVNFEEEN